MKQQILHEKVIVEYPYRPFGWLIVTSDRLIFKKIAPWINTFSGIIQLTDIKNVRLIRKKSLFATPQLELTYADSSRNSVKTLRIHFPGFVTRAGIEVSKGISPESLHRAIVELLKTNEGTK